MADPRLARPEWRGRTNVDAFTIAWIEHAEHIKRTRWASRPELHHPFDVTQGGYQGNGGDPDSAGTHARGGGTDFVWCGHIECLLALRLAGGFVWWRNELWRNGVRVWPDHMHGAPIDHPDMAPALQRQQTAYFNRRDGLAGNGPDDGPRLDPIPRPVWPWPQEEDMPTAKEVVDELLARKMKVKRGNQKVEVTFEQMVVETFNRAERVDEDAIAARVVRSLPDLSVVGGTLTESQLREAVKQAIREGTGA